MASRAEIFRSQSQAFFQLKSIFYSHVLVDGWMYEPPSALRSYFRMYHTHPAARGTYNSLVNWLRQFWLQMSPADRRLMAPAVKAIMKAAAEMAYEYEMREIEEKL